MIGGDRGGLVVVSLAGLESVDSLHSGMADLAVIVNTLEGHLMKSIDSTKSRLDSSLSEVVVNEAVTGLDSLSLVELVLL